ncbi:MAG: FMN-binding glutamate synthase family protein, partial [Desulfosalsimonas sp.]
AVNPDRREKLSGHWDKLPKTVSSLGGTAEEIFAGYYDVEAKVGKDEMKNIPYGAIALWTLSDKLSCGLQQLMAGARKFSVPEIHRSDLFSGNRETAEITGIPFVCDANDETAKKILNS